MKNTIFYVIAPAMLLLTYCSSIKDDWKNAKEENNIQGYEQFIIKHPQSAYIDSAILFIYNKTIKYKVLNPDDGFGSYTKNIEITMNEDGTYNLKATSDSSNIPMTMNLNGGNPEYRLASLGSKNIKIAVNKTVGNTKFAGLIFDKEVTLNINTDSTVELSEENILVKDYLNNNWISRKLKYNNATRILLVANELQNMADMKQRQKIEDSIRIADSIYDAVTNYKPKEIFQIVEEMPAFPGGPESLMKFIDENTIYPPLAKENNIGGRVYVRFVVLYNGKIGETSIIRGIDPLLDAEAIRVIKKLPRWQPGKQNGKRVNVYMIQPVNFKMQ